MSAGDQGPSRTPEEPAEVPDEHPAASPPAPLGEGETASDGTTVIPLGAVPAEELGWWDRASLWWGARPPRTPRERARARAIRRGVVVGFVFIMVVSMVKLPLLILSPGPTYNTIGEVDGQPLISITGTTTYPTGGMLDMTTISERGGSSGGVYLGEALLGWAAPGRAVIPRESIYGPETTGAEVAERNDQLFALSQSDSIAAAMNELGIPTEQAIVVTVVGGGSPADGIVQAGDQILTVDGQEVASPAQVGQLVREREVGDTVVLEVLRREEPGAQPTRETLEVVTAANPQPEDSASTPQPYLGIVVGTAYEPPFDIEFGDSNVGGPSAGMMFSLGMIDILTPGELNGGRHVAGTGTIDPQGTVGPIGGIRQKLVGAERAGAELFLAPQSNCDEVEGSIPDGLTVIPVSTLGEARDALERWVADPDADFPECGEGLAAAGR